MGGILAIAFGIVLALLGLTLLFDYRQLGVRLVERTILNSLRTGDPERYRRVLGLSYLLGGIAFAVVGVVVLVT